MTEELVMPWTCTCRRGRDKRNARDETSGGKLSSAVLSVQLDYLPVCGNASTVLCYLLCLLLNLRYDFTQHLSTDWGW